jgi:hypothetical protein
VPTSYAAADMCRTSCGLGQTWDVRQQRQPDRYEQCARDRLEPMLGPLRCMDPGGGPEGAHDFEADLDDGGFAAIEVTGEVESGQRALESLVRRLPPLTVPGSRWRWQTGLAWVSADAARQGRVILSPGTYGGWEWGGAATDSWLAEFLASPRGINKVVKLRSVSKADQWHLVIVLDPAQPGWDGHHLAGVLGRAPRAPASGAADPSLAAAHADGLAWALLGMRQRLVGPHRKRRCQRRVRELPGS